MRSIFPVFSPPPDDLDAEERALWRRDQWRDLFYAWRASFRRRICRTFGHKPLVAHAYQSKHDGHFEWKSCPRCYMELEGKSPGVGVYLKDNYTMETFKEMQEQESPLFRAFSKE